MKSDLDEEYIPLYTKQQKEMPKPPVITRWRGMIDITQEQFRAWLIIYDPEGEAFWRSLPDDNNFRDAVYYNIRDFGFQDSDDPDTRIDT